MTVQIKKAPLCLALALAPATALANDPPELSCRDYLEVAVDAQCNWELTNEDLTPDFTDPEGEALTCEASPPSGLGLQAKPIVNECADPLGQYGPTFCEPIVYPYDDQGPTISTADPDPVVDVSAGGTEWLEYNLEALCGMTVEDNCTQDLTITTAILGVIELEAAGIGTSTVPGQPGWFVSDSVAATWDTIWINPDPSLPERRYAILYGAGDEFINVSLDLCTVHVQRDP
jgi:hypothetical protein